MFHHRSSSKKPQTKEQQRASLKSENRGGIKKFAAGSLAKQDRLNAQRQIREDKKAELMAKKRMGFADTRAAPPKVVVLIPFHTQADTLSLKRRILEACGGSAAEAAATLPPHVPVAALLPAFAQGAPGSGKPRVLLVDPPRDMIAALDAAKCADIVVCVLGPHATLEEPSFDDHGYRLLTALKSQGLPVVMGVIHGGSDEMSTTSAKKSADSKKLIQRYFHSELGEENKIMSAGTEDEVKAFVRQLGVVTPKELILRQDRGYMLAQEAQYTSAEGILCLKGYVRGSGLRCKHPVHLTGHGDFQVARIAVGADPCPLSANRSGAMESERPVDELASGANLQLTRLRPYDPTEEEQTWPTNEELGVAARDEKRRQVAAARRIAAPGAAEIPIGGESEMDDEDMEGGASGSRSRPEAGEGEAEDAMEDDGEASEDGGVTPSVAETDEWDVSSNMTMDIPTADALASERRRRQVLADRNKEDMEFPDEVDTPMDVPARERFQKYRGLKSFRTSPWDPYEDLPVAYGRIWEFESFSSTARAYRQQFLDECEEIEDGGVGSLYCHVYLKGVPPSVMDSHPSGNCFILSSLFPCEEKVSVMHSHVQRVKDYSEVIKSKQEVQLHCGFRRFPARPIYSEIPKKASQCKKYKFSRFFNPEETVCASFYSPTIFPPCSVLMFTQTPSGLELMASGPLKGADPKQLIIKKSVLAGYPFRVHKSKGVVRFMFFRPDDIRWFKPVELSTKKGLRGHIIESLGTHGYMKCRFSAHIRQDDTVCMNLFKRCYPKWHPPSWGGSLEDTPETAAC